MVFLHREDVDESYQMSQNGQGSVFRKFLPWFCYLEIQAFPVEGLRTPHPNKRGDLHAAASKQIANLHKTKTQMETFQNSIYDCLKWKK